MFGRGRLTLRQRRRLVRSRPAHGLDGTPLARRAYAAPCREAVAAVVLRSARRAEERPPWWRSPSGGLCRVCAARAHPETGGGSFVEDLLEPAPEHAFGVKGHLHAGHLGISPHALVG